LWLDFSDATDADRALIASLTPDELANCVAAATETAQTMAAEIRARRDARVGHPAWCVPELCSPDATGGYLRDVLHLGRVWSHPLGMKFMCTLQLARGDNHDGSSEDRPSNIDVRMDGAPGGVEPVDLESLGVWLTGHARDARRDIATEGVTA